MRDNELPTKDKCDLSKPDEVFLWMYLGMPDIIGADLAFPVDWWKKVSEHQIDCGAMLRCPNCGHMQEPKKKYRIDPHANPMLGASGHWVKASEPEPERDHVAEALAKITPQVRKAMFDRLRAEFPDDPALKPEGQS